MRCHRRVARETQVLDGDCGARSGRNWRDVAAQAQQITRLQRYAVFLKRLSQPHRCIDQRIALGSAEFFALPVLRHDDRHARELIEEGGALLDFDTRADSTTAECNVG